MCIVFDPIGYSKALQDAGMPRQQADVIARAQGASINNVIEAKELVTKTDLDAHIEKAAFALPVSRCRRLPTCQQPSVAHIAIENVHFQSQRRFPKGMRSAPSQPPSKGRPNP